MTTVIFCFRAAKKNKLRVFIVGTAALHIVTSDILLLEKAILVIKSLPSPRPLTDFPTQMICRFTLSCTCRLLSRSDSPLSLCELHESICVQMTQLQPKSLHSQWHFKCQSHISSGSYSSSDPSAEPGATFKTPPETIFTMAQSPRVQAQLTVSEWLFNTLVYMNDTLKQCD